MTKAIRIENADNSDHKVVVEVWQHGPKEGDPHGKITEVDLDYPTSMITEYVHSGQYIVIKEVPK